MTARFFELKKRMCLDCQQLPPPTKISEIRMSSSSLTRPQSAGNLLRTPLNPRMKSCPEINTVWNFTRKNWCNSLTSLLQSNWESFLADIWDAVIDETEMIRDVRELDTRTALKATSWLGAQTYNMVLWGSQANKLLSPTLKRMIQHDSHSLFKTDTVAVVAIAEQPLEGTTPVPVYQRPWCRSSRGDHHLWCTDGIISPRCDLYVIR